MAVTKDAAWGIAKKAVMEHHEHCCGRIDSVEEGLQKTNEGIANLMGRLEVYRELGALKPHQKMLVGGAAASGWIAVAGLVLQKALGLG